MSTDRAFVDYLQDQLRPLAARVRFHRMFGEYALYLDEKVAALVCDNQVFLKMTAAGRALLGAAAREGQPYPGAKPWLQLGVEVEDHDRLCELLKATAAELPMPKPKLAKKAAKVAAKVAAKKAAGQPARSAAKTPTKDAPAQPAAAGTRRTRKDSAGKA